MGSRARGMSRRKQQGAALGGVLVRATFFVGSYDGLRSSSASATQHIVPNATVRSGDFSGGALIFDPLNLDASGARKPFPNNRIPDRRIDHAAKRYLATYEPLPNIPDSGGNNYLHATPNRDHAANGSIRVHRA